MRSGLAVAWPRRKRTKAEWEMKPEESGIVAPKRETA